VGRGWKKARAGRASAGSWGDGDDRKSNAGAGRNKESSARIALQEIESLERE
jgi:hypothetical protein